MPATVYFDTTIVSYLTAKTSRNLQIAEQQQLTYDWWNVQRINYELCCSQLAREEASLGDPVYARRRLELLQTMKQVPITDAALAIAEDLIREGAPPAKAEDDAVHIATATVNQITYLLTWNCQHLANPQMQKKTAEVCAAHGLTPTTICTPKQLMELTP